jgi:hypothetical protein
VPGDLFAAWDVCWMASGCHLSDVWAPGEGEGPGERSRTRRRGPPLATIRALGPARRKGGRAGALHPRPRFVQTGPHNGHCSPLQRRRTHADRADGPGIPLELAHGSASPLCHRGKSLYPLRLHSRGRWKAGVCVGLSSSAYENVRTNEYMRCCELRTDRTTPPHFRLCVSLDTLALLALTSISTV